MGRIREMKERVPGNLKAAEERGDLYGAAAHRTALATMAWLAEDDVPAARERVREAMRHWSRGGFQVEHFWELLAESQHDLYAGDWQLGLTRMRTQWKPLAASLLLRVQLSRLEAIHARARVLVAAAAARRSLRKELAASAARDARAIAAERTRWATPMADLLLAAVESLADRPIAAAARLRSAVAGFEGAEMALYAAAARWRLGELLRGDEGKTLVESARAWMLAEGIVAPERMLAMLAPGFRP
jgi:eukaryotic-like serine/threonine-protein kinase